MLGFVISDSTFFEVFHDIDSVLCKISMYPANEENRVKFQMSIRAARAKSYWKEVEGTNEATDQQSAPADG